MEIIKPICSRIAPLAGLAWTVYWSANIQNVWDKRELLAQRFGAITRFDPSTGMTLTSELPEKVLEMSHQLIDLNSTIHNAELQVGIGIVVILFSLFAAHRLNHRARQETSPI